MTGTAATAPSLLEAKQMQAEHKLSYLRAAVVVFNASVYLLGGAPSPFPWLAHAVILVSLAYSLLLVLARPYQEHAFLLSGAFTTAVDSVLISAWIVATGGASSPFFLLWLGSIVAVSLRFDLPRTLWATAVYAVLHVAIVLAMGQWAEAWLDTLIVAAYVVFVGVVAGFGAAFRTDESAARVEATTHMADARAAETRFRRLLEFSPDPIVVVDAARRVSIMNGGAERVFQVPRSALLGRDVAELVAPESREAYARWHADVLAGGPAAGARTGAFRGRRGASTFPLEVTTSPLEGEEGVQIICVMRDIGERLAAEEERVANAARLREIERLREIDRFKTQFINTAAHELGTPLTPIKMQVHVLERGREGMDERQRRAVEILKRNVARLSDLVQDVLDVARAQAERLGIERRPVDLNRVVMEALESFEESARREGIALRSSLTPNLVLPADEKRLTQVLFNLISNAVKFSPAGSEVTVSTARRGDEAVLVVKDTGIGVDPALQHRLFQPFSQLQDPKERTRSGSGLGLYISKSLVELHGGRIALHSAGAGQGATFTITLPLRVPAAPPKAPAPAPPAPPAPAPAARNALQNRIDELV